MKYTKSYTDELIYAFMVASKLAIQFKEQTIRTGHIVLALYLSETSYLNYMFEKKFEDYCVYDLFSMILTEKEVFEKVFGIKSAQKYFDNTVDEKEEEALKNEIMESLGSISEEEMNFLLNLDMLNYSLTYSDDLMKAINDASKKVCVDNNSVIDEKTLLNEILLNTNSSGYRIFKRVLKDSANRKINTNEFIKKELFRGSKVKQKPSSILPPNLKDFCIVLNDKYVKGEECDILGREKEVNAVFRVLGKKTKRNVILLGEAGVGKTAIVEAITQNIVNGNCPEKFKGFSVVSLSVSDMVSNTEFRGQFEEKIKHLKRFIQNNKKVIIFIDEIHQIVGAGKTEQSNSDLVDSLKPLLARDEAYLIGATTPDFYEGYIVCDGALDRRFKPITIEEPKISQLKYIISKKINKLEKFHNVKITEEGIDRAILYGLYFRSNSNNPDKTLDIIDEAMVEAEYRDGKNEVTFNDIDAVYKEQFEAHAKTTYVEKKATAYHEAAHYIAYAYSEHLPKIYEALCVSIIGYGTQGGATVISKKDEKHVFDIAVMREYVIFLLAGRYAQERYGDTRVKDEGGTADYKEANKIIVNMLTSTMSEKDTSHLITDKKDLFTDDTKDSILRLAKDELNKLENETIKFLDSHVRELIIVANYLLENNIVTGEELKKLLEL